MIRLKTILTEQNDLDVGLNSVLQKQRAVFETCLNALKQIDMNGIDEAAQETLRTNSEILCQAYLEYCKNTEGTIQENPGAAQEDLVDENANTMLERIEGGLIR